MITDIVSNSFLYEDLNNRIQKALHYLKTTDLLKLQVGRYDIDGNNIYALISTYTTKPFEEGKFEAHRQYIDIQYLIEGAEKLYYAPVRDMEELVPYTNEKDIAFYKGTGDYVTAVPGKFVIFFPTDAHMPCIAMDKPLVVRKLVIKVRVN